MDLQGKRAALVANQEHLLGQINRVGGAIAVVDELLAEQAQEDAKETAEPALNGCGDPDCAYDTLEAPDAPPTAPEMLPIVPEDAA